APPGRGLFDDDQVSREQAGRPLVRHPYVDGPGLPREVRDLHDAGRPGLRHDDFLYFDGTVVLGRWRILICRPRGGLGLCRRPGVLRLHNRHSPHAYSGTQGQSRLLGGSIMNRTVGPRAWALCVAIPLMTIVAGCGREIGSSPRQIVDPPKRIISSSYEDE